MAVTLAASLLAAAPANAEHTTGHSTLSVENVNGIWSAVWNGETGGGQPLTDANGEPLWAPCPTDDVAHCQPKPEGAQTYPRPGVSYAHGKEVRHIPSYPGDWAIVPITRCVYFGKTIDCALSTLPVGHDEFVEITVARYECSGPVAPDSQRQPEGWVSIECNSERLAALRAEEARLAQVARAQEAAARAADRLNCEANRQHLRELNAEVARANDGRQRVSPSGSCTAIAERIIQYPVLSLTYTHKGIALHTLPKAERDALLQQKEEDERYFRSLPRCRVDDRTNTWGQSEAWCNEQGGDFYPGE